jgi:hypothetical protein
MSPTRAATYIGALSLFAAWLASAAGVIWQPRAMPPPRTPAGSTIEPIAFDVQAQADRLHRRLSAAPVPRTPVRNPFVFSSRQPQERRTAPRVAPPPVETAPVAIAEPELVLIGVAEQKTPAGIVRTAMIQGPAQELLMVKVGEMVAGRYKVTAIGADAIEMADSATGRIRRLALK